MKYTVITVVAILIIIGGMLFITRGQRSTTASQKNKVTVVEGKQIIQIRAKGGYTPLQSTAKAGLPTTIRFDTQGTFDCSSVVRIPSMGIARNLPPSGTTDIDVGSPIAGFLYGTCGMGMYPFEIVFES